jgi:hypothetical protein
MASTGLDSAPSSSEIGVDLLTIPGLGALLRSRRARPVVQVPLLVLSGAMVLHGLFGPTLSPKNLATTLTWVHFRGLLVLGLLAIGNAFCLACPFVLVRDVARRFHVPRRNWPRRLRNKWLSVGLFVLVLFAYELFDLWASPFWTAALIALYFLAVLLVDTIFKHASFCKFVCPLGQFNFAASLLSPFEVAIRSEATCASCRTHDCIRGRRDGGPEGPVTQRGCELALYLPLKKGNMDCTFCLDCVHACPHDNVGVLSRLPAAELLGDPRRSGIGRFSGRTDIAALGIVFTFGALLNVFGMVSPVYAVESWLSRLLHLSHEAPVLGLIFGALLVAEPILLLGGAAVASRLLAGGREGALRTAVRYSYALVPLGFGIWLAHYGFHFLTGLLTFVPVVQSALVDLGVPLLGAPRWTLTGVPVRFVRPLEAGFILLGFLGALFVAHGIAEDQHGDRAFRGFLPWALVSLLVALSALWLMAQPMEMRATFLQG